MEPECCEDNMTQVMEMISVENGNETRIATEKSLYLSSPRIIVIYCILFVISSIGNTTVFISLIKNRNRKLRINLLILHLTIADLIVTYIMIPTEIVWRFTSAWLAGDFMCRVMQAFRAFGPYLSSMVLVCISIDRYFAVVHPFKVNDAHRRSKIMLTFAWLASLACSLPQTIVFHTAGHPTFPDFVQCVSYDTLQLEWQETFYSTFGIVAVYVFPLIVIICCYTRILWEIRNRSKDSASDSSSNRHSLVQSSESQSSLHRIQRSSTMIAATTTTSNNNGRNRFHLRRSTASHIEKARTRTLRMTIIIVLAFVWCWTPYASIVLLFHFYKQKVDNMPKDLRETLFMFAVSNSCVDPLVYGLYTMDLRALCRRLWIRVFSRSQAPWRSSDLLSKLSSAEKDDDDSKNNTSNNNRDSIKSSQAAEFEVTNLSPTSMASRSNSVVEDMDVSSY